MDRIYEAILALVTLRDVLDSFGVSRANKI
jgi:hypothetical protein